MLWVGKVNYGITLQEPNGPTQEGHFDQTWWERLQSGALRKLLLLTGLDLSSLVMDGCLL